MEEPQFARALFDGTIEWKLFVFTALIALQGFLIGGLMSLFDGWVRPFRMLAGLIAAFSIVVFALEKDASLEERRLGTAVGQLAEERETARDSLNDVITRNCVRLDTTGEPDVVRARAADQFILCRMARLAEETVSGTITEGNLREKFDALSEAVSTHAAFLAQRAAEAEEVTSAAMDVRAAFEVLHAAETEHATAEELDALLYWFILIFAFGASIEVGNELRHPIGAAWRTAARWVTWLFGRRNQTPKDGDGGSDCGSGTDRAQSQAQPAQPLPDAGKVTEGS